MKQPPPLRTRSASWRSIIAALLGLLTSLRAGTAAAPVPAGSLMFSIEKHPGKGDYVVCKLSASGTYILYGAPESLRGSLPAPESQRILEEFEKLCHLTGVDGDPAAPRRGGAPRILPPFFLFETPRAKMLALSGPQNPAPPELTAFLITLRQKLLYHASQNPRPAPAPAPSPNIPPSLR